MTKQGRFDPEKPPPPPWIPLLCDERCVIQMRDREPECVFADYSGPPGTERPIRLFCLIEHEADLQRLRQERQHLQIDPA